MIPPPDTKDGMLTVVGSKIVMLLGCMDLFNRKREGW